MPLHVPSAPLGHHRHDKKLGSQVLCVGLLVGALLMLREATPDQEQYQWAVIRAFRQHPPSGRIFRSLLEWNLLLWGTVVSLALWYRYVGKTIVAALLFTTPTQGHNDWGDEPGSAVDAKARSTTYSSLRQHSNQDDEPSENMFADYDASFTEVTTGTKDEHDGVDFVVPQQQQQQTSPLMKALGDPMVQVSTLELVQRNTDATKNPIDTDTTGGEDVSEAPSGYDAQPSVPDAPTVAATAAAALDMLLPTLMALFFFTLSSTREFHHRLPQGSWVAPLIPLLLVGYLTVTQLLRPWKARQHFFTVLAWTVSAPLYPVTFRDGFIGDIFTSTVRPLQDAAFTLCYILSGLQGYWSDGYEGFWDSVHPQGLQDEDASDTIAVATLAPSHNSLLVLPPMETSWWLHTVLLPMCMVSPLWWRFLQNLRQAHDHRRRWPYLGNAFKYLLAAEVAMFGVFDPSKRQTYHWLGWFVIATLYQIWWDVFMDWELLVPTPQRGIFRLRDKRLYPSRAFYWTLLVVNFLLRFCWTLSFLPARYLNQAGVLSDTFQHSDWSRALAPAIASAEILRRTMWGWIRLENEAIKVAAQEHENPLLLPPQVILELHYRGENPEEAFGDALDGMTPMSMGDLPTQQWATVSKRNGILPTLWESCKTLEGNHEIQILGELALWATVFATLAMVAAYHRMTL